MPFRLLFQTAAAMAKLTRRQNMKTLTIQFDTPMALSEVPFFRGAVIASLCKADVLFHNHEKEGLRYSYPLVQYKSIGDRAAIFCIGDGTKVIGSFLSSGQHDMFIGHEWRELHITDVSSDDAGFDFAGADQEYTIEEMEAIEAEQDAAIAAIEAQAAAVRAAAEAAAAAAAQAAAEQAAQQAEQAEEAADDGDTSSPTDAVPQQEEQPTVPTTLNTYTGGAFTWPLPGYYTITSSFGSREAPTEGASSFHKGVDIGCADGAPIVAAADGVVSYTGYFGGGGNTVIIDHGNGLCTLYMHMSGFAVGDGANVTAGTVIGYAGSTGISTGPHLHFAVRVGGEYADPMGYL